MALVFTYGPHSSAGRMRDRVKGAKLVGGALLEGHRLVFDKPNVKKKGEGLANLAKDDAAKAFGVLFDVPAPDMDLLDGFFGGYGRKAIEVNVRGEARAAETWFARRTTRGLKPSKQTIAQVKQALEEISAPKAFIEELEAIEVLDE
jgi:hypothetical protein